MPRLYAATTGICPMKASSEQREDEHRHEAPAHDGVRPGHRDAGGELAPAAGVRRHLREGREGDHQQRRHDEQVGDRVAGEDPRRADDRVEHAADHRADDAGGVHLGRIERDGAGHVGPADEAGEDGRIGRPEHRAAHTDHEHHEHQQDVRRMRGEHHQRHAKGEHQLLDGEDDEEALAVDLVRQQAADHWEEESRAELGEDDDADEGARVRQIVGVGAEDHVLHPGADVRGEGAQEDDAECPV